MAKDNNLGVFFLSPVNEIVPAGTGYIAVAMHHGKSRSFKFCDKFHRTPVFIDVAVAADSIDRYAGLCFQIRCVMTVITGMKPEIDLSRVKDDAVHGLFDAMGITDDSNPHFIFLHWLTSFFAALAR